MAYPPIDVVNEHDEVVGNAPLAEIWEKGLWHRVVHVVVENAAGQILLQRRAQIMIIYPGCWDISAAGHVDLGETYEQAATRELAEEVGLKGLPLESLGRFKQAGTYRGGRKANRFFEIFRVRANELPKEYINEEVAEVRWFSMSEIKELIETHPEVVADALLQTYRRLWQKE